MQIFTLIVVGKLALAHWEVLRRGQCCVDAGSNQKENQMSSSKHTCKCLCLGREATQTTWALSPINLCNLRMAEVAGNLRRFSLPLRQGPLERITQNCFQMALECLQGRRLHNHSGQPVTVLNYPFSQQFFSLRQSFLMFQFECGLVHGLGCEHRDYSRSKGPREALWSSEALFVFQDAGRPWGTLPCLGFWSYKMGLVNCIWCLLLHFIYWWKMWCEICGQSLLPRGNEFALK